MFAAATMAVALATCRATPAAIRGRMVCLRIGAICAIRNERIYRSYAFTCRLQHDGRHRLRVYNFIGRPNP